MSSLSIAIAEIRERAARLKAEAESKLRGESKGTPLDWMAAALGKELSGTATDADRAEWEVKLAKLRAMNRKVRELPRLSDAELTARIGDLNFYALRDLGERAFRGSGPFTAS